MVQRLIPIRPYGPANEPTAREINALVAWAEYGDKAAETIGIAHQTLKNQVWNLCRKLGVSGGLQAYHALRLRDLDALAERVGDVFGPDKEDGYHPELRKGWAQARAVFLMLIKEDSDA